MVSAASAEDIYGHSGTQRHLQLRTPHREIQSQRKNPGELTYFRLKNSKTAPPPTKLCEKH